jgi:hypothetical protein
MCRCIKKNIFEWFIIFQLGAPTILFLIILAPVTIKSVYQTARPILGISP